jgi:hypothetical protein
MTLAAHHTKFRIARPRKLPTATSPTVFKPRFFIPFSHPTSIFSFDHLASRVDVMESGPFTTSLGPCSRRNILVSRSLSRAQARPSFSFLLPISSDRFIVLLVCDLDINIVIVVIVSATPSHRRTRIRTSRSPRAYIRRLFLHPGQFVYFSPTSSITPQNSRL